MRQGRWEQKLRVSNIETSRNKVDAVPMFTRVKPSLLTGFRSGPMEEALTVLRRPLAVELREEGKQ